MITYSRESDWTAILPAERGVSHRSTTSSRLPGRAIEGSVNFNIARIIPCEDCGTMRRASPYPHAPRWLNVGGRFVRVDCRGVEVAP